MFRHSSGRSELHQENGRRTTAPVELFTMAALAVSTVIAATAVSIGIARADVVGAVAESQAATAAVTLAIGLVMSGMLLIPPLRRARGSDSLSVLNSACG